MSNDGYMLEYGYIALTLLPFVLLHLSMFEFLRRYGRREGSFRQAFYVLFMSGTLTDCGVLVAVR